MELKDYQNKILNDLDRFLSLTQETKNFDDAFRRFWVESIPSIQPFSGTAVEPYKNNVPHAPHLCVKVPTGGGKTLIASAALKTIFDAYNDLCYRTVVWLVPSNTILEQTLRNLRNKEHPYRQRIDTDFANRVEVLDKQQALTGQSFNISTARENLCILVMSYDSFRTKDKDGRKVYQDNGYLQSFESIADKTADFDGLMAVLRGLHPVVIVDESHNATSKLSEDMIRDLLPSFVLDLTATPRKNSNILSFTDALKLRENNMVKLPVIVYNHHNKNQVIDSALHLQRKLEQTAQQYSDRYIRPIVLFQAESRLGTEERETFDKVKQTLLDCNIPEEQIKIKTADINEIKDMDLMSPDCPVRYIITVNALKEGWDCPFAYILASLADRSSSVDVEQIVGRVLRLPYTRQNPDAVLNMSYVLTASSKFQETLNNVVKGLNNAGFSENDYRAVDSEDVAEPVKLEDNFLVGPDLFEGTASAPKIETEKEDEMDSTMISFKSDEPYNEQEKHKDVDDILTMGIEANIEMNAKIEDAKSHPDDNIPSELHKNVKQAKIQSIFADSAHEILLPEFFMPAEPNMQQSVFDLENEDVRFSSDHLLRDFKLAEQDTMISFVAAETSMYRVDIDKENDDHAPRYFKIDNKAQHDFLMGYLRAAENLDSKIHRCASAVTSAIGKMNPLSDKDVTAYITRILSPMSEDEIEDFVSHINEYKDIIRAKIIELEDAFKLKQFKKMIDQDKILVKPSYKLPNTITLKEVGKAIPKSLYGKEEAVNGFEEEVINAVANLSNVEFWTRNVERRGFAINGFINHYPDFIIKMKSGKIIALETKGDHLDAENKILLGSLWASKCAPYNCRYFMVYQTRVVGGAYTKNEFLEVLKNL